MTETSPTLRHRPVAPCSRRWRCFQPYPRPHPSPRQPRPLRAAYCHYGMRDPPNKRSSTSSETRQTGQVRNSCRPRNALATFDQDGTLWVEQPIYSQMVYCLDRVPVFDRARACAKGG